MAAVFHGHVGSGSSDAVISSLACALVIWTPRSPLRHPSAQRTSDYSMLAFHMQQQIKKEGKQGLRDNMPGLPHETAGPGWSVTG